MLVYQDRCAVWCLCSHHLSVMPFLVVQAPPAGKKAAAPAKHAAAGKASPVGSKRQRSSAGFTDHNASWLKPSKKQQQQQDSESEEDADVTSDEFESGSLDEGMSGDLGSSEDMQQQSLSGGEEGCEDEGESEEPPSKKTKQLQKGTGTRGT